MNPNGGDKELLLESLNLAPKKKASVRDNPDSPMFKKTEENLESTPDRDKKRPGSALKRNNYPSQRSFSLAHLESSNIEESNQEINDESSINLNKQFEVYGDPILLSEKEDVSGKELEDNSFSDLTQKDLSKTDIGSSSNKNADGRADNRRKSMWVTEENTGNSEGFVLKGKNFSVELMKNNTEESDETQKPELRRRFSSWGKQKQLSISPNNRRKSIGVINNQPILKKLKRAQTKSNRVMAEELALENAKGIGIGDKKISKRKSLFNMVGNFFGRSDQKEAKDADSTPKFVKQEEKRESRSGSLFKRLMTGKRDSKKNKEGSLINLDVALEAAEPVKRNSAVENFSLEDIKFFKETIETEKKILEQELKDVTMNQVSSMKMQLNNHTGEKWSRAKKHIKVAARMKKITEDIKQFGTSMNLLGVPLSHLEVLEDMIHITHRRKGIYFILDAMLVHPEGNFKSIWANFLLFLLVYTAFITPYSIAFIDELQGSIYIVSIIVDILYALDIFITLNSSYYNDNGKLVVSRTKIFLSYLKSWLLLDILAIFPFQLISPTLSGNGADLEENDSNSDYNDILKLLRLPRIYRLIRLARLLKMIKRAKKNRLLLILQDFFNFNSAAIRLLNFIFTIMVCVHLMGCLWYFVAKIQTYNPDTWVTR
jgi:hypothetical protein